MYRITCATVAVLLAVSRPAYAEESGQPCDGAFRFSRGDVMTCDGTGLSRQEFKRLVEIETRYEGAAEKIRLLEEELAAAAKDAAARLKVAQDGWDACARDKIPQPLPKQPLRWYETAEFKFAIGFTAGVAITASVFWLAKEVGQ